MILQIFKMLRSTSLRGNLESMKSLNFYFLEVIKWKYPIIGLRGLNDFYVRKFDFHLRRFDFHV